MSFGGGRAVLWVGGGTSAFALATVGVGTALHALADGNLYVVVGGTAGLAVVAGCVAWLWLRKPIMSLAQVVALATASSSGVTTVKPHALGSRLSAVSTAVDTLLWRLQMANREAEQQSRSLRETTAGMRELVTALVHTEEVVRAQLAADIHDTVAQSLAIAKRQVNSSDDVPRSLADAVDDAEEQVRAVISRTRPVMLEGGDLAAAVHALCDDVHNRYGLVIHLVGWPDADHAMPVSVATVCYRFVQEAIMNVTKHASTDECFVALGVEGRTITLSVTDHGGGFDPSLVKSAGGRHVGLHLLSERARLMGGSVQVCSAPGESTVLRLRLPVPERRVNPSRAANGPEVLGQRTRPSSANA